MGNEVEPQHLPASLPPQRPARIFSSKEDHHCQPVSVMTFPTKERPAFDNEQGEIRDKGTRMSRKSEGGPRGQRKFLSLTKEAEGDSKLQMSQHSCSRQRKGIKLTPTSPNNLKYSIAQVINYQNPVNRTRDSNSIKKNSVRPRDLPRHSSQKVIPVMIPSSHVPAISNKIIPERSHSITRLTYLPEQPQITVKYACPVQAPFTAYQHSSIQSSKVTPFRPMQTFSNWAQRPASEEVQGKRLKKVPMTRSYDSKPSNEQISVVQPQNQEQSMCVKEVSDMTKLRNHLTEQKSKLQSTQTNKQNLELFTDKKLLSYITSKTSNMANKHSKLESFKESESKYALAYERNGVYIEHLMDYKPLSESITKDSVRIGNKYSVAVDKWTTSDGSCSKLQAKVDREVLSNPVIEEPFRFPTATDISEDDRSDNTSFLPIQRQHNQSDSYIQLSGEDIVNFCKPRINSKVLADMLRLPLKS